MMNGKNKHGADKPEILIHAEALESALSHYDALVTEAEKTPLETRKGIERAARTTQEAAQVGEEMGQLVATLARAIQEMSTRQNQRSEALLLRSREIKKRHEEMVALTMKFEELAAESTRINTDVQGFAQTEMPTDEAKAEFLRTLSGRMVPLIDAAKDLATAARDATFPELEKSATSLSQTLASAKNKVELTAKRLIP